MHGVGRALAHIGKDGVHNACIVFAHGTRHDSRCPTHSTQAFMLVWARGPTTDMKHGFSSIHQESVKCPDGDGRLQGLHGSMGLQAFVVHSGVVNRPLSHSKFLAQNKYRGFGLTSERLVFKRF